MDEEKLVTMYEGINASTSGLIQGIKKFVRDYKVSDHDMFYCFCGRLHDELIPALIGDYETYCRYTNDTKSSFKVTPIFITSVEKHDLITGYKIDIEISTRRMQVTLTAGLTAALTAVLYDASDPDNYKLFNYQSALQYNKRTHAGLEELSNDLYRVMLLVNDFFDPTVPTIV
ncbi:MAG: hypothetical protein M3005_03460 [Apilactobacillus sp.]|uniref:hypothetical protein n=1 Tax=Apilactobacillus sp. TaxID=2767901 RepID=UPI0025D51F2C|nr:hypothetical protein [Apilactobacillus sp.]MCT6822913.1 hypothetical protein [Apilactobacillus sp.]MCT6858331.1 hypothetical protein [Apilactobacillus sp.]